MRLRFKIVYLFASCFFRVKNSFKMGIVEIGFYFLLEMLASFF